MLRENFGCDESPCCANMGNDICEAFDHVKQWEVVAWRIDHPLLQVSKQVRSEASEYYPLALEISRRIRCWCRKDEKGHPVFYSFLECTFRDIFPDHLLQAAATCDDFRGLLPESLRTSVKYLTLNSICGLDGNYISKTQFPKLEVVHFGSMIVLREDSPLSIFDDPNATGDIFKVETKKSVEYTLTEDEHPWDIKAGKHDKVFIEEATQLANKLTIRNMPDRAERGFAIRIWASVHVWRHANHGGDRERKACRMVCLAITLCRFQLTLIQVLVFDYDTGEPLSRPRFWMDPFYKDVHCPRYSIEPSQNYPDLRPQVPSFSGATRPVHIGGLANWR